MLSPVGILWMIYPSICNWFIVDWRHALKNLNYAAIGIITCSVSCRHNCTLGFVRCKGKTNKAATLHSFFQFQIQPMFTCWFMVKKKVFLLRWTFVLDHWGGLYWTLSLRWSLLDLITEVVSIGLDHWGGLYWTWSLTSSLLDLISEVVSIGHLTVQLICLLLLAFCPKCLFCFNCLVWWVKHHFDNILVKYLYSCQLTCWFYWQQNWCISTCLQSDWQLYWL